MQCDQVSYDICTGNIESLKKQLGLQKVQTIWTDARTYSINVTWTYSWSSLHHREQIKWGESPSLCRAQEITSKCPSRIMHLIMMTPNSKLLYILDSVNRLNWCKSTNKFITLEGSGGGPHRAQTWKDISVRIGTLQASIIVCTNQCEDDSILAIPFLRKNQLIVDLAKRHLWQIQGGLGKVSAIQWRAASIALGSPSK